MDNYPDLKAINDFYKSLYKNNWEKYISVFHYMMVKNNFMVKDGISTTRFVYAKNSKDELFIQYEKGASSLLCKVHHDVSFFLVDIQKNLQYMPWIRINLDDYLTYDKKDLKRLPELMNTFTSYIAMIDHSNPSPTQSTTARPSNEISALQVDTTLPNKNLDNETTYDSLLRTPNLQ